MDPRFPGFDVLDQSPTWDPVTAAVVEERLRPPSDLRFFSPAEAAIARPMLDLLLGQEEERIVPLLELVDARLAAGSTDGWRYEDLPEDAVAWRATLMALDEDARLRHGRGFANCAVLEQTALLQRVQDAGSQAWHGWPADRVWSLWTRYACTAFYAHPSAWNEIGFGGPAYPRGYKNRGVDRREPWEVADARPTLPDHRPAPNSGSDDRPRADVAQADGVQ
jgi:Gluconate 2-dehydrogenase subunit 3